MNFPNPIITDKPPIIPVNTRKPKKEKGPKERQKEIDKEVQDFLKRGGAIQKVSSETSGKDSRKGDPVSYNPYPIMEDE